MIDWIIPGGGRPTLKYISVAVTTGGGQDHLQISVRLSEAACKDMRIIEGDRVLLGIDKVSKQICIKRVTNAQASIKVTKSSGKESNVKTLRIQCKSPFPLHKTIQIEKARCHIESNHIAIDVPELFK